MSIVLGKLHVDISNKDERPAISRGVGSAVFLVFRIHSFSCCGSRILHRAEGPGAHFSAWLHILEIHWKSVGIHSPEYWLERSALISQRHARSLPPVEN